MKSPTHAVRFRDNAMGDGDIVYCFAYKRGEQWIDYDTNRNILQYDGDEILQTWSLSDQASNAVVQRQERSVAE